MSGPSSADLDHDARQGLANDDATRSHEPPMPKAAGAPMAKPVPPGSTQPMPKSRRDEDKASDSTQAEYYEPDQALRRGARKDFEDQWDAVRDSIEPAKAGDPFGGGHGKKSAIEDGKTVGQGGFGLRLIGESVDMAQANAAEWGELARPVAMATEALDAGYKQQADFVESHQGQSGHAYMLGDDPMWVQAQNKYSTGWATENMESIERYKLEQSRFVGAHNTWVPLANSSHMAMAELVESSKIMGFDGGSGKDAARFVQGLETSLDMAGDLVNAKMLGEDKQTSYARRADDKTATSKTQPALKGEQLSPRLDTIAAAYRDVQTTSDGIYIALLEDKKAALIRSQGEVTAEITEINEVIEFWSGVAETTQGIAKKAKPLVNGTTAQKIEQKLGNGDRHAKKAYKAAGRAAKQGAKDVEKDPSNDTKVWQSHARLNEFRDHNETWGGAPVTVTADEGTEHPAEGGHTPEAEGASAEGGIDISAGGLVKLGLTLANKAKLDELKNKLATLGAQVTATDGALMFAKTTAAQKAAASAQAKLVEEMKKIDEESIQDREQDMVGLGSDLDKYAAEHQGDLKRLKEGGLVAAEHRELYATMMACVAKVEKFRAVSKLATGTFPFNDLIHTFRGMTGERNGRAKPRESTARDLTKTGHPPPRLPTLGGAEGAVYSEMSHSYKAVMDQDVHWGIRLEGVVARFEGLMKSLAGGTKHATGKKF